MDIISPGSSQIERYPQDKPNQIRIWKYLWYQPTSDPSRWDSMVPRQSNSHQQKPTQDMNRQHQAIQYLLKDHSLQAHLHHSPEVNTKVNMNCHSDNGEWSPHASNHHSPNPMPLSPANQAHLFRIRSKKPETDDLIAPALTAAPKRHADYCNSFVCTRPNPAR